MAGSSVNFQPVKSAAHAVSHVSRDVVPSYLLPEDKTYGTIVVLDDKGEVSSTLEAKMALASRQALREKNYSPIWEGVLNLRRPEQGEDAAAYRKECAGVVREWCKQYENLSGHKVLRADVHLDEGHIENGEALLNAHAHVIADRTNEKGRVITVDAPKLRKVQDMTAKVTGLQRGKNSIETKLKHLPHQAYKYLAEQGRLETQQAVVEVEESKRKALGIHVEHARSDRKQIKELKDELDDLKTKYAAERAALKASGKAVQSDYQALKKEHAAALENLSSAESKAAKVPVLEAKVEELEATVTTQADQIAALKDQYRLDREALKATGTAKQADYQALKKTHEAALKKLAMAESQAAKVPVLEAHVEGLELSLESSKKKVKEMDDYSKELSARLAAADEKIAAELIEKANAIEALVREGIKSEALLVTAEGHRHAAEKLIAQPTFLERFSEWVKELVEKFGKSPTEKKEGGQYVGKVMEVMPGDGAWAQKTSKDGEWVVHKGMAPPLDQVAEVKFRDGVSLLKGQQVGKGGKGPAD